MIKKIRFRFIVVTMSIVTVMLLIVFTLVIQLTSKRLGNDNIKFMQNVADAPININRPDDDTTESHNFRLPAFRIEVAGDGSVISTSGSFFDLSDEALVKTLVDTALSSDSDTGTISAYSLRYLRIPVSELHLKRDKKTMIPDIDVPDTDNPDTAISSDPDAMMLVFADISTERNTMRGLYKNCVIIGLASFAVFFFISRIFAKWATKPVEEAWNQQKQFVSDASHELKTPLTVILTNAELLKSALSGSSTRGSDNMTSESNVSGAQGSGNSVHAVKSTRNPVQFADNIITMSRQMRGLTESLLDMARIDNDSIKKAEFSKFDLSHTLENEMLTFDALFYEKGMQVTEDIAEGISLYGSESHIRQLIGILLDNAQKYGTKDGKVSVTLSKSGSHHIQLSVSNSGDAISKEDLKNIFKRFYRIDKVRSMNHSYGLGLSIAESIVMSHHGRIWAESESGMNTFIVELPD